MVITKKVFIHTASGSNIKTNDSVPDMLKVSGQMLKLLDSMGITPTGAEGAADGEM